MMHSFASWNSGGSSFPVQIPQRQRVRRSSSVILDSGHRTNPNIEANASLLKNYYTSFRTSYFFIQESSDKNVFVKCVMCPHFLIGFFSNSDRKIWSTCSLTPEVDHVRDRLVHKFQKSIIVHKRVWSRSNPFRIRSQAILSSIRYLPFVLID